MHPRDQRRERSAPVHLHGFYFNVDSQETGDVAFPSSGSAHMVNTERMDVGRTMTLSWTPSRLELAVPLP